MKSNHIDYIPYGHQSISESDIEAVVQILRSDWLTQGPSVPAFEKAVSQRCQAGYGLAVNSATSALHIACVALDVGPGDTVWTCPNTFVASANCARYCGASVDFVDIDPETWCMCVQRLEEKLEQHEADGLPIPKVVIPVHLSGQSCDMQAIADLGSKYGFRVIEDASHAFGGSYRSEPVGSCRFSDIVVFSFHPVKIITTGEGGMLLTNDPELHRRMARLRTHGITRDPDQMTREPEGPWYYEQLELGFNYRMTDMQAALGLSQLERLEEFVDTRNALARRYDEALEDLPLRKQKVPKEVWPARHLFVIRVPTQRHRVVFESLHSAGIGVNVHYIPVHLHPYYRSFGFVEGYFPESEAYAQEAVSLPLYPDLSHEAQDHVIATLNEHV